MPFALGTEDPVYWYINGDERLCIPVALTARFIHLVSMGNLVDTKRSHVYTIT